MAKRGQEIAISDIVEATKQRSIIVRIVRLVEHTDSAGLISFDMMLLDSQGSKIQLFVNKKFAENFKELFTEGGIFKIANFVVIKNELQPWQKTRVKHQSKLMFSFATKVSPVDTPVLISDHGLNLSSFEDIIRGGIPIPSEDWMLDVIGEVILPLGEAQFIQSRNAKLLDVELIDTRGNALTAVLWDNHAEDMKKFIDGRDDSVDEPVILILQMVQVSMFKEQLRVGTMKNWTKMFINPPFPEVKDFLQRRGPERPSISRSRSCKTNCSQNSSGDDWLKATDIMVISDLFSSNEFGVKNILATITDVDIDNGWYYDGCDKFNCIKGLSKSSKYCDKCKKDAETVIPRFKIRIEVMDDDNGVAYFMLFDNTATYLLNESAANILSNVKEGTLPTGLNPLLNMECIFKVDFNKTTQEKADKNRSFTVRQITNDVSIISQYRALTNKDEVVSKLTVIDADENDLIEDVGDSAEDKTPKKRKIDEATDIHDVQLSITKVKKNIKQEK